MKRPPSRLNFEIAIFSGFSDGLCGADHHEELRALEIGSAELPERSTDRVDHSGRHVDRAETAVRRVVGRAELPREETRERLHLVAAGEHRELGVGGADFREALFQDRKASSQLITMNSPAPRSAPGRRRSGRVSRAGEYCFMMPELPFAQITPLLIGCSGLPSMYRTSPFRTCTRIPHRHAHM